MGENCKKIKDKHIHKLLIQGRSYFDILLHNAPNLVANNVVHDGELVTL